MTDELKQPVKVEAQGVEGKWEGQEIEVKSDPLIDYGQGKNLLLRVFEYSINPALPPEVKLTKQDLFNAHSAQIRAFLWKDGLVPQEEFAPRIRISKKQKKYRIFVLCIARTNQMWLDRPRTIQDIIKS